ncbi:hypothetical protein GGS26DRAFT_530600 [Hypomontagnella submonticulosa]|nr:hypothetical protein GGS26DRAFT_530600 [Hypomontagnella submonticulosa]
MRGLSRSTLFHKKSKSNLSSSSSSRKNSLEDQRAAAALQHARKWSTSSSVSQTSTATCASHETRLYDPLSLHPPLSLNTSPHIIPEYDEARFREDELERQNSYFDQATPRAVEYSPAKDHESYFTRPASGRPYVYDQSIQWPLKDWQAIPPGLAELDSSASSPANSPTRPIGHRRRPTNWMNDRDALLKRGDWKRRGIVFHLDEDDEEQQEQHFELPE